MTKPKKIKRKIEVVIKVDGEPFLLLDIEGTNYLSRWNEFFRDTPEVGIEVFGKLKRHFKEEEATFREKKEDMDRYPFVSRVTKN